jgi:hypothetical protein
VIDTSLPNVVEPFSKPCKKVSKSPPIMGVRGARLPHFGIIMLMVPYNY